MMSSSTNDSLNLDTERFSTDTVFLSDTEVEQATTLSSTIRPADQWPAYLNALAFIGFQHWLAERGIDIDLNDPSCSVNQPILAGMFKAVCNVSIHGFTLCLIPTGSLTDDRIAVPRGTVELPAFVPHLFVGIEVQEEYRQVKIWGWLRHDHLQSHITGLQVSPDWTYAVPRSWFDSNTDSILLYLTCLEPQSIARCALKRPLSLHSDTLATLLSTLAPRLHTSLKPLWKLLTWEQASEILMHPELRRSLASIITSSNSQEINKTLSIPQAVIQVGQWLHHQLDPIAQAWAWSLLPPIPALRGEERLQGIPSPVEQFEQIVTTLSQQGINVPSHACGAYRDLEGNGVALRLYVVTWDLSASSQSPEWVLLLLLGAHSDHELPANISLTVRDSLHVLDQQILNHSSPDAYLFSQVVGEWHEQFWVSIDLTNGFSITLPPFTFVESQV